MLLAQPRGTAEAAGVGITGHRSRVTTGSRAGEDYGTIAGPAGRNPVRRPRWSSKPGRSRHCECHGTSQVDLAGLDATSAEQDAGEDP